MGFKDQREWIEKLEKEGELKKIKAAVDWDEEMGAITREVQSRGAQGPDRKSTRLNSSHIQKSRMPSSA